jgi:hypothetical protein
MWFVLFIGGEVALCFNIPFFFDMFLSMLPLPLYLLFCKGCLMMKNYCP